ncbi:MULTISPECIES: hotdog family protein [unclassified Caballeronia]|uniref:hotdog family protein n=1 Tax=unclassified Caballeronia TaxID=2646786 RepID=UPI00285E85A8|nr:MULTISPECIES: hotdog family protein [unclassified Caballeronia]MDR5816837.1 hotdog family protein [Caballeronia sp. LZ033]MDR5823747.1 hotdog family protein [Caballeronia sp. LZ043]
MLSAARTLNRDEIAARIPHDGAMCLLESVVAWNAERIRCTATSHLAADNPLRFKDRLASVCGIEYAAQAMATHGGLIGTERGQRPRAGLLTSVRGVDLFVDRLDGLDGPLDIEAERIGGDENTVLYRFSVQCAGRLLLSGRAAVILDAGQSAGCAAPGLTAQ